jgi:tRNA threonylcarbamoyl adenosine modification protein YeaZ
MKTDTPTTLALEFSSTSGSIALMNNSGESITVPITIGRNENDDVFPSIEKTAATLGISANELELVIVSIGPGGFTGLRTAVAIAKMVSLVSGATIVPVESAIVCVQHADKGDGPFAVVSSVKGEEFWLSNIVRRGGLWVCSSKISTTKDLLQDTKHAVGVFADSFLPEDATETFQQLGIPVCASAHDARALLKVGLDHYKEGESIEPESLLPIYPREPEAVRVWKARKKHNSK